MNNVFSVFENHAVKLCDLADYLDVTYTQCVVRGEESIQFLGKEEHIELLWNFSQLLDCKTGGDVDATFSADAIEAMYEHQEFVEGAEDLLDLYGELH